MRLARIVLALAMLVVGSSSSFAQNGCVRLSWGTCDPQVEERTYTGPAVYKLVESAFGVSAANVGTDIWIRVYHLAVSPSPAPLPDAWRFDDAGCQGSSRLTVTSDAFAKACPTMRGANPTSAATFVINADGTASLRLTSFYDSFAPLPTTHYTVLQVLFDQTHSNVGPTPPDGSTCGMAEFCVNLLIERADLIAASGERLPLSLCDQDALRCASATWNGGCEIIHVGGCPELDPVPTLPTTWGKVKSLYR